MGLIFGLVKRLVKLSIYLTILAAFIVFIPNLPPYTKFTSISLEAPQPRVGPLAPNGALNNADRVYVDKLLGPEAFQLYKGELYTSLATGEIVKISPGGHVTFVTTLGQPCTGLSQEHICGRPLGFQIDERNNVMYVADAYLGVWKVDLKHDKKQLLVSPRVSIEGRVPKLINSIALSKNGDLYWTDSTSDYHLKDGAMSSLSDPSGRLFQYNSAKNQSKVLLDNLWFPNGVAISPDNQFVVVLETFRLRLLKYYIDGPKKGKSEVFVAGLPGAPDNVQVLPDGSGLLVGLYVTYDDENPLLTRRTAETPLARKLMARVQRLIEIPFEYLNTLYPHVIFNDIVYHIGHFKSVSDALPKQSGLVVVDWNGNIVESYYNTDGSLERISDAVVYNDRLFMGNPHFNYIGSVAVPPLLKKAFGRKAETAPKQQAKPVETPKPKVEEKPKVEVKKEAPKPVVQPKPAPQKQAKPNPPVQKPAPPKPVEQSKPAPKKPTKPEPVKAPTQPKQEKPTPKPEAKTPTTPKATAKPTTQNPPAKKTPEVKTTPKPAPKAKPAEPEPEFEMPIVTRPKEEALREINNKLAPENIPIKEEIPLDTTKPNKETLKVIKKGGPAEIPNPHL